MTRKKKKRKTESCQTKTEKNSITHSNTPLDSRQTQCGMTKKQYKGI